jgi:hypothetical protein
MGGTDAKEGIRQRKGKQKKRKAPQSSKRDGKRERERERGTNRVNLNNYAINQGKKNHIYFS